MPLTADDVVQKRFNPTKFREGYDQDEVDDFLDEVVAELRRLNEENEDLRRQLGKGDGSTAEPSADAKGDPAATADSATADSDTVTPAPATGAPVPVATSTGGGDVAGMLALAQRLHDEHVANGEQERDRLIGEAQETSTRLVRDAEEKQAETLGNLETERALLERKIDELRGFERDYRSRLKSYLENQLRELDSKGQVVPGRTPGTTGGRNAGDGDSAASGFPLGGQN